MFILTYYLDILQGKERHLAQNEMIFATGKLTAFYMGQIFSLDKFEVFWNFIGLGLVKYQLLEDWAKN